MSNDMPLRVHDLTPAEIAEWDAFDANAAPGLGRVNCRECRNRSGSMCVPLRTGHVPLELNHRCAHHSPPKRRAP